MVIAVVIVLVVVVVAVALVAYQRSDKSRHETEQQYLNRREGDALERRYQEEHRRREELPPTHET
jgi:hypothetical protein